MSALSNLETELGIIETDVVNFFHKAVADVEAAATWLDTKALPWLGAHAQEIAADVTGAIGIIGAVSGTPLPAAAIAAQGAIDLAASLVDKAVAAQQAAAAQGASAIQQAVAAGGAAYQGLKSAQASAAVLQSQVATPAPAPAATPAS